MPNYNLFNWLFNLEDPSDATKLSLECTSDASKLTQKKKVHYCKKKKNISHLFTYFWLCWYLMKKNWKIDICKMHYQMVARSMSHCCKILLKHKQTSVFQQQRFYSSISENKNNNKIKWLDPFVFKTGNYVSKYFIRNVRAISIWWESVILKEKSFLPKFHS